MNHHSPAKLKPSLPFLTKIILVLILSAATSLATGAGDNTATNAPGPSAGTNAPDGLAPELDNYMTFPVAAPADGGSRAASPSTVAADTNSDGVAPEPGQFPTPAAATPADARPRDQAREFQDQLEKARQQRREKNPAQAANILTALLQTKDAPPELLRPALFELALAAQDNNQPLKAQQVYAQYLRHFPEDPTVPEVLLRQGMLYRQMGVTSLAISKFYAVMSTALKLKLDNIDYYKKLVLQAQIEIADTYYLEGKYTEAADYLQPPAQDRRAGTGQNADPVQTDPLAFLPDQSHGNGRQGPGVPGTLSQFARTCRKSASCSLRR